MGVSAKSLQRTDKEIAALYERHVKTVFLVCFAHMKNTADADDMMQETFLRLIAGGRAFNDAEHEKAWLIRTAANLCKNSLRHWWHKREKLEDHETLLSKEPFQIDETLEVIMGLPDRYKTAIYMYYYEGYSSVEIARALSKPQSTIRNYLCEARELLKSRLGGVFNDEERTDHQLMGQSSAGSGHAGSRSE